MVVRSIVMFGAKDERLNEQLTNKINRGMNICVSGTVWEGNPALGLLLVHGKLMLTST